MRSGIPKIVTASTPVKTEKDQDTNGKKIKEEPAAEKETNGKKRAADDDAGGEVKKVKEETAEA